MRCKKCGFDNKKSIGKSMEAINEGETGWIEMNDNGKKWIKHKAKYLKEMGDLRFK